MDELDNWYLKLTLDVEVTEEDLQEACPLAPAINRAMKQFFSGTWEFVVGFPEAPEACADVTQVVDDLDRGVKRTAKFRQLVHVSKKLFPGQLLHPSFCGAARARLQAKRNPGSV